MAAPQTLIQKWTVTEPYINIHCALGEAPLYEAERNHLRFVDIKKKQLHVIDLAVGPESLKTIQLDVPVGVTADIEGVDSSEKILVGSKYGVAILDRRTEKYTVIKRFYDDKTNDDRMRSNDGAVDPQGRLWIGTMNDFHIDPLQSEGTLFRFDGDFKRTNIREGLTIPNGLGWSRDHKTLFFTHSTEATIYAYDYDEETGAATNQRVFWKLDSPLAGEPDGFVIDEEGNIWQAIYGEARVLKINPQGQVVGEISYPTRCVTCPVFIGTELWVTTASEGDPENYPESAKHGGGIFKVDVGVRGLKDFKFKLAKELSIEGTAVV